MDELSAVEKKKSHRERLSGRKADKKKSKKDAQNPVAAELSDKQRNPKAFAFNSAVRAERRFRHKQDVETKKQHIPLVDRTPLEPPPIIITVVGPPKVGKTTLINNLIKLYTKAPLTDIKGPVTIVIGKKRRITLIECNNDINSMIDLAKVTDLALLLCDASFGFEMEFFEFLNICQVHGMPRIMGVLTHLDMIKNAKTLKTTKKTLKHRFWAEVYPGAKLFYLSGILHGEYLRNEIKNLGRFISCMKFRPLTWRTTHSYILGDRFEDLTNQEVIRRDPKCNRNISLYGYVRGVPLLKSNSVHVAGLGDFKISDVSFLPDPCPLPEELKKRALVEKEKLIYAPFSGVGGIVYDKDAVYVELGGSHSHSKTTDTNDELDDIVTNLIETKETLDSKLKKSELQIFTGGEKLTSDYTEEKNSKTSAPQQINNYKKSASLEDSDLEEELSLLRKENRSDEEHNVKNEQQNVVTATKLTNTSLDVHLKVKNLLKSIDEKELHVESDQDENEDSDQDSEEEKSTKKFDLEASSDSDDSSGDDDGDDYDDIGGEGEDGLRWKENLAKKAQDAFLERQNSTKNMMKLVYGYKKNINKEKQEEDEEKTEDDEGEEIGGLFKVASLKQQKLKLEKDNMNVMESSLFVPWNESTRDWLSSENKALIENCFVTGKWRESEDAAELLKLDDAQISDDGSEIFGDFEDLETGEKHTEKRKREPDEVDDKEALAEKKRKLKEKFDAEYDDGEKTSYYEDLKMSAEKQSQLNKKTFENLSDDVRVQIEGYRPGMYVRLEFEDVPSEFITNFDPTYPLVIGALNMGEENIGFVNVKIKKHRWHKKILKTNDPVIMSLGWRRFETIPLFSKLEDDLKFRYLKYTPEHLSCNAHFWGPITPQGTGFLVVQNFNPETETLKKQGFRIAATGAVQELDKSTQIMKKLKLIGYPLKIYKKTAFIKGMFNSALEVSKFEGARIKTVSGIRGQIKKAVAKPEGCYRATFEDKIQLSDIVFCRTWYKVKVPQYYNPVTTLLLPLDKKDSWRGVRTTGQIKRESNIRNEANTDSLYTPITREPKVFKPLMIPAKLQQMLPYKDKPKYGVKPSEAKKRLERVAVIKEPYEQKVSSLMKMVKASYEHKQLKMKQEMKERMEKHRRMVEAEELKKTKKMREQKKQVLRAKSKAQIREEKGGKGRKRATRRDKEDTF